MSDRFVANESGNDEETWDIFGTALYDYYADQFQPPFVWLRSDGQVSEQSIGSYFAQLEAWGLAERAVLEHVAGRILDVGCGAGKHILEFQSRGLSAVGVDISPRAIEVCQRRGVAQAMTMSAFDLRFPPGSFDCVTLLANNLAMGGDPAGIRALLGQIAQVTTSTGTIVLTQTDVTRTTNPIHTAYQRANREAGRPLGQIRLRQKYAGMCSDWFFWMFVAPDELDSLAGPAGWRVINVIAGSGGEYCAVLQKSL